jgi:hypothetical protein
MEHNAHLPFSQSLQLVMTPRAVAYVDNNSSLANASTWAVPFSSLFTNLINITPLSWLTTTISQFLAKSSAEDSEYVDLDRKYDLLSAQRDGEYKAVKYMALYYPGYYWQKYVLPFDQGSDRRKEAVFLFMLLNRVVYGDYYGAKDWDTGLLDKEVVEMGLPAGTVQALNARLHEMEVVGGILERGKGIEEHGLVEDWDRITVDDVRRMEDEMGLKPCDQS